MLVFNREKRFFPDAFFPFALWEAKQSFTLKEIDLSKDIDAIAGWVPKLVWTIDELITEEGVKYLTGREWKVKVGQKFVLLEVDHKERAILRAEKDYKEIVSVIFPAIRAEEYFDLKDDEAKWFIKGISV